MYNPSIFSRQEVQKEKRVSFVVRFCILRLKSHSGEVNIQIFTFTPVLILKLWQLRI